MRAVVQRVSRASVKVGGVEIGNIKKGLLVLLAVHKNDGEDLIIKMAEKILKLRIFQDNDGKMNCSVKDLNAELLVVSQFTLYGDTRKGNRPGFTDSARPEKAIPFYEKFVSLLRESGLIVATGKFGSEMEVELINDGPVTVIVDV